MAESENDRMARQTAELRAVFDMALSNKRKYPVKEFRAFVQSARRYIEITAGDPMIHRSVAYGPDIRTVETRAGWNAGASLGRIR